MRNYKEKATRNTIAHLLEISNTYGSPRKVMSNKGPAFSTTFEAYCKQNNINHKWRIADNCGIGTSIQALRGALRHHKGDATNLQHIVSGINKINGHQHKLNNTKEEHSSTDTEGN